jgi:hypothetical protein
MGELRFHSGHALRSFALLFCAGTSRSFLHELQQQQPELPSGSSSSSGWHRPSHCLTHAMQCSCSCWILCSTFLQHPSTAALKSTLQQQQHKLVLAVLLQLLQQRRLVHSC